MSHGEEVVFSMIDREREQGGVVVLCFTGVVSQELTLRAEVRDYLSGVIVKRLKGAKVNSVFFYGQVS